MPPIDENGFLDKDIKHFINKHRRENAHWFELCKDLNRFCHEFKFHMKVHKDNGQETLAAVLYIRILDTFQGIIILAERGMIKETQILLRAMLEALFALRAIANDENVVEELILDDEHRRKRVLENMKKLGPEIKQRFMGEYTEEEINKEILTLREKIKQQKIKAITPTYLAEKAHLVNHYLVVYPLLSSVVHAGIRSLESYLQINETGDLSRFEWGPDVEESEIAQVLFQAAEFVVFALIPLLDIFRLDIKAKIVEFQKRYQELGKVIDDSN